MKQLILIVLVSLYSQLLLAQQGGLPQPKYPELFKHIPSIEPDAPQWVKTLYAGDPNFFELRRQVQEYFQNHPFEKSIHTQNLKHLCKLVQSNNYILDDGTIYIPSATEKEAGKEARQTNALKAMTADGSAWQPVGPFATYQAGGAKQLSVSTNIYCFEQSLSHPDIIYAGAETGAVFKSVDKAQSWFSIGDDVFDDGAIDIIAVHPLNPNIVYVGAGNRLFKSVNGGQIWSVISQFSDNVTYHARFFTAMVVHPENPSILYLARKGEGLFKSTDAGLSWTKLIEQDCWDIKFKVDDASTVYVAVTNPDKNITEIHKSVDNGSSFTPCNSGWFNPVNGVALTNFGARMAVTNADPDRLYAIVIGNEKDNDAGFIGLFRSDDAGETWYMPYEGSDGIANNQVGGPYSDSHWCLTSFQPTTNGNNYNLGFYALDIEVSDEDPDLLLAGAINLFRSDDGGKTLRWWGGYGCEVCGEDYQAPFERHADIQEIEINGADVWVISDGGVDRYDTSLDNPVACNVGMNGSEYWGFDQGWNQDVYTGGRYHNGNAAYFEAYGEGNNLFLGGGESATGYINAGDNLRVHHSDIKGKLLPQDITEHVIDFPALSKFPSESYIWYFQDRSELEIDPRCWNTLYIGRDNVLWKSENGGVYFQAVYTFGDKSNEDNRIKAIEVSRNNPSLIFLTQRVDGSSGLLWKTTDAGATWSQVTLPEGGDDAMRLGFNTEDELFLTIRKRVYKSNDLGSSWEPMPDPRLSTEIIDVIAQEGTDGGLYIATSDAVWYKNNQMATWSNFSKGLPAHFRVTKMKPFYRDGKIRLAGNRGIWERPLFEASKPKAQPMVSDRMIDCGRVQFEDFSVLNHDDAQWQWSFPGATMVSDSQVRNPEVLYDQPGEYDVTLTIKDKEGQTDSKTIKAMVTKSDVVCPSWTEPAQALSCTGGYSYAKTQEQSSIKNINTLTIKGWIKPAGIQNNNVMILGIEEQTGAAYRHGLVIRSNNGSNVLSFQWNGVPYAGDEVNPLVLPVDEWSYVSMVVQPGQVQLKANNQKVIIAHDTESFGLGYLVVGSPSYNDATSYVGLIDEVSYWTRALTESEIDLSRHLIARNYDQQQLVACYHFDNKGESQSTTPDALALHQLRFFGSGLMTSDAPISTGSSQELVVNNNQLYDYTDVGVILDYQGNGILPNGKVVISRLDREPVLASDAQVMSPSWTINNYGSASANDGLKALHVSSSLWDVQKLESIELYSQNENAVKRWAKLDATIKSAGDHGFRIEPVELTNFGQLALSANLKTAVEQVGDGHGVFVYPNPVRRDETIQVEGMDENYSLTLYAMSGKEVLKKVNIYSGPISLEGIKPGVYLYHIVGDTSMSYGKLIVN